LQQETGGGRSRERLQYENLNRKVVIMKSELFKVKGSCVEFIPLPEPISKIGRGKIFLNGKHFSECANDGYHRFINKPLTIFGVEEEIEKGKIAPDSILAFGTTNTDSVRAVMLKCFKNPKKLLRVLQKEFK
jgi:hypothetical protein